MPLLKILPSLISQGSFTGSFSGTSSYARRSLTASYALNASGGGSTLRTGSTYPITSSYARKAVTSSYLTTISQSLVPAKNNTYSLGTSTKKWKDIYVSTASIYFDNFPLRVAVKNNSPQLLFNTSSIVTVPSGSNPSTSSYATKALTASYALNTFFQTGSIVKQTILYNVVSGSSNTISGLSLDGNKWDVSVVEEWDAISGDLFYNSCSLLMHFSGSNGSTTFTDNSPSTKTVTSNNGASISSAQSKFGSRSGLFDGVDDYLIISGNTVCNFGSGDFTVECWVRLNAMPTSDAWPTNYSSHFVVITAGTPSAADGIGFIIGQTKLIVQSNDTQMPNALHGMTTNTWYHIAYVRRGNNLYFFVNGSQVGTTQTLTGAVGTGTNTYIGCETTHGAFFNGYMDELRVTKGLARYVSNFTTSSAEFGNVRGQVATKYIGTVGGLNDRSVDYGVQKLTDSSLKVIKMSSTTLPYPASSGSLSQSVSRVYVNVLDYTKVAVTSSYASRALTASYALNASGGGGSTLRTGSTYPITSSFARRAITASYALNTFFQTGSIVKQTLWTNVTSGSSNTISGLSLGGNKWDVSVVEEWDAAVLDQYYNSCSLLCHFDTLNPTGRFIDNSRNNFVITSSGEVTINAGVYKFGGGSGFFDGTGDYLVTPSNSVFTFGTGDLTIECWIYQTATSVGAYKVIVADNVYGSVGGWTLYSYNNQLNLWKGGTELITPSGTLSLNTWNHVVWTRSGGNNRIFINGIQVGSTVSDSTNYTATSIYVGASKVPSLFWPGYIDELRITKGVARYTANFTPPKAPFPNSRTQVNTRYIGVVGGINDKFADYGVQKLSDSSLLVRKLTAVTSPVYGSGSLSASIDRVYVNVLDYTKVAVTSSYASRALTASYALNATGGGGSTLRTGSTYPITSSYSSRAITASYALNASGGGSTLRTGSTYPFTSSWSTRTSAIANSTTNRIPKYTAANTLSTTVSPIFESGSAFIGIGPISTSLVSRLQVYRSGSNSSVFRVDGGSGTLFEVTDALSGSLFSVNDITGLPIFEVFSNNRVIAGTVNSNALVVTGSSVGIGTSTPQTKLHVLGNISGSQFTSSRRNAVGFSGTASYARRSLTASYALNASGGGGGSTLRTGSTYPITSSWSTRTTAIANSTTNRIPKYTAANTLSTTVSPIFESGSAFIGVGPISTSLVSRLQVYRSGSNASVFRVDGGSGTLFEVTDALSGSLFSVNDITGLPIFEVFSNNRVIAGTVNSNALVVTGSNVGIGTSVPAVKLQVSGTIAPAGDNIHPLGRSTNRFSDVFAAQTTIGGLFETGLRTDKLGQLPTGTIVSWEVNGCVASSKEEDELVMGVVKNGKDEPLILGAEPILVTGVVNVGDYIVTSNKVGHGKAIKRGNIFKKDLFGKVIAQALESGNGESYLIKGMIRKM